MIALFAYRIALILLLPVVLLLLLIRYKSNPQYRQKLSERLGFFPKPIKKGGIIVHAASVGEVLALRGFIEQLLVLYPHLPLTVTTFTPTGAEQVRKLFEGRVQMGYLPLDILPCTTLFLHQLQPELIIFMETELWPNLVSQCANKKIKLLLINGRLSDNSMKSYKKLSSLITPTLNRFDNILAQSQDNAVNFLKLGAVKAKCSVSGNLKFDIKIDNAITEKQQELNALLPSERPILLLASSHEGDEEIVLEAYEHLLTAHPTLLLILVPRHPERFEQVANLCSHRNLSVAKRSDNELITTQQIWLLDTLGELMATFSCADIVMMGGTFSTIGGHNPLEPAFFSKPIIVGDDMTNFKEISQQLLQSSAMVQLTNRHKKEPSQALTEALMDLLPDKEKQAKLGKKALDVVMQNQGATQTTLSAVHALVNTSTSPNHLSKK